MTVKMDVEIECPKCGKKSETVVWSSLNATLNPEDKNKLIQGQINVFHCPNCGDDGYVQTDFLYHDMENDFCVQFYPANSMTKSNFLEQFDKDGKLKPSPLFGPDTPEYFRNIHVVFDMRELVRYVIFRGRLAKYISEQQ